MYIYFKTLTIDEEYLLTNGQPHVSQCWTLG